METVKLHFKKQGTGPELFILHGLLGSLDNWQTVANALTEKYTVFLVDLRNHGRSPHHPDMNYTQMSADVLQLIAEQATGPCYILGHSMGGKIAMQCLADQPDLFIRGMIVDIGPKKYIGGHEEILDAMTTIDLTKIEKRSDGDDLLKTKIPDFGVRQFILKNLDRDGENGFRWKCNLEAIMKNYEKISAELQFDHAVEIPVCFLAGEKSNYILPVDQAAIRATFLNAEFISIPGAGHWVHAEKPEETIKIILEYFR